MASRNTTRARDIDRSNTCTLLDAGYGEGQLDFDEHKSRTAAAMSARTLGELESLVTDLQLPTALTDTLTAADRPAPPRRGVLLAGVAAAVVAAAVTLVLINQDGPDPAAAAPPIAPVAPNHPAPPAPDKYADVAPRVVAPIDTLTAAGIEDFIRIYRDKFGDTLVYDVYFRSDYTNLTRMVPGQPGSEQDYTFRGGFDPDSVSSRSGDEPPFDLASVDLGALAGHLLGAAESVQVPGGTISYIGMQVHGGDPTVSINVNNEETGASGSLELSPKGEVTRVSVYSPHG
ncbi:hypothetical protein BTZ20_0124 [Rhodococcus sp. MTM3W5.2]|uniref:DUF1707 SHOCT-like domain-containing protein n=1 Tax=Rhodococcus sp. MTM3W5.2 TaxID=1805827 RepID=UPI000979068C|nr:DUF1707 domain-containing protein [Rhodococcus sp. MTM3W5.2]AQA23010.1 hypothetical protein BTZ20_0124 [Rhodococcus sp. MTM3W5.2]